MSFCRVFLCTFALAVGVSAQVKKPEVPPSKPDFGRSQQLVVVITKDWNSVEGRAHMFERKNAGAKWKADGEEFAVVVGRNGLAWAEAPAGDNTAKVKKEGDGNAPAGIFPLTAAFGKGSKPNAVELPYTKLEEFTECVDDPHSQFYNRIVNRMHVGNFDWKSSEKMLAVGEQYDLGIFVGYNSYPVQKSRGSCIFLHIWKSPTDGTAGCTAMERRMLEGLVAWAIPSKNPYIVQFPADVYEKYRKSWNLPKFK